MRILVAGATGAVGRNLLARLVAAGHQVVGTTRTEAKAPLKRRLGGEALVADGLDAGAVQRAVRSAKEVLPEADEIVEFSGAAVFDSFAQSYPPEESLSPLNSADALSNIRPALALPPPQWDGERDLIAASGRSSSRPCRR